MDKYRSLVAWKRAHEVLLILLKAADTHYHPRSRSLLDQIRRAVISVEANIVEGYALGTTMQFRRHLRIAMGSAAEAECLLRVAGELEYLPRSLVDSETGHLERLMATIVGLLKKLSKHVRA
jgi:four helix bundle protein